MTFTSAQLSEAFSVAVDHVNKSIPDIMTQASAFLNIMMENKNLKYVDGGKQFRMPVNDAEIQSKGWINGRTDTISVNPNRQTTHGLLDWKYFNWNMSITLEELVITHNTPKAVADLMVEKAVQAQRSVKRDLANTIHESGTSTNKQWNGLPDVAAASGTAYAGLTNTDLADSTLWLMERDTTTSIPSFASISGMIGKIREKINHIGAQGKNQENFKLDLLISRQRVMDKFEQRQQISQQYVNSTQLDAGFDGIKIKGCDWYPDAFAPGTAATADNYLYVLSTNSFKIFYKYGFEGKKSPLDTSIILPNQPIMADINYMVANLGCTNRRVNGVFTGLEAG